MGTIGAMQSGRSLPRPIACAGHDVCEACHTDVVSLKLLFEDLRFGDAASLVVSLLFYGLILILLPRLTRRGADPSGLDQ
jgi:hypothetical protein